MARISAAQRSATSAAKSLASTDALLGFALRHAVIQGFFGSRQETTSDGYRLAPRIVPDYNLIYIWTGTAQWVVGGSVHDLPSGALLVVPPGILHHGRSRSRHLVFGSVHVLAELPGGRDCFTLFSIPRQRTVAAGSSLDRMFRMAMEEYQRGDADAAAMIAPWSVLIMKELLRHDAAAGLLRSSGADPLVVELLSVLERRLGDPPSLAELARHAGYSPQHLNRRFRQALGATPLHCLANLRWARARELLRGGRLSIQAVGKAVGYRDPAYFSRCFHAHAHCSPSAYREAGGSGSPSA